MHAMRLCFGCSECRLHASCPCIASHTRPTFVLCVREQSGGLFNTHGAKSRHYCVAVFDNQRGGTVIGASIMRQREVVFDITSSSISFVDANCDTITPETSHLRESYTFAPCGGSEGASGGGSFSSSHAAAAPLHSSSSSSSTSAHNGNGGGNTSSWFASATKAFANGAGWSGRSMPAKGAGPGRSSIKTIVPRTQPRAQQAAARKASA